MAQLLVTLKNPYNFEGTDYTNIDLSGLEKLTVKDAVDAQNRLVRQGEMMAAMQAETSQAYLDEIAAVGAGMPIEFFQMLPYGECRKVRQAVQMFLGEAPEDKEHVLPLMAPYTYEGETAEEIDLSNVKQLNSMNVRAAEKQTAAAGATLSEPAAGYFYCCCIAAMATNRKVEFYTGMPLREAVRIKGAVNDADFFG
jgi:hypothetical protein